MSQYAQQGQYDRIPLLIQSLRQIDSNVSVEHTLFSLFLELMK